MSRTVRNAVTRTVDYTNRRYLSYRTAATEARTVMLDAKRTARSRLT